VLPQSAVFGWSPSDARALFDAMVDGDGHRRPDGRMSFMQKDLAVAEAFQMLAVRRGYRTTLTTHSHSGTYVVQVSPARWIDLRTGRDGLLPATDRERYEGIVWCPSVSTGAWLARRNGQPFITGCSAALSRRSASAVGAAEMGRHGVGARRPAIGAR
jgi:hypothetical protein